VSTGIRTAVARLRWNPVLLLTAMITGTTAAWATGALLGWWRAPLAGWLGIPVLCGLTTYACWQASAAPGLARPARRFWRSVGISLGTLGAAAISNMIDALTGPGAPAQKFGPVTLGLYVATVLITQWSLLRLPGEAGATGGWLQFTLDSGAVMVTASVFAWHFSFRHTDRWTAVSGSAGPLLAVVVLGFVSIVAFVKIASVGISTLDRRALRLLAAATATCTAIGATAPLLRDFPHVNNAQLSIPVACVMVTLAADRQRRAAGTPPRPVTRRRAWSTVPYAAVAATNALLVIDGGGSDGRLLAVGAAVLTALVVVRQIAAFAENNRLLGNLREARDQLIHQANHDELTQLANRRLLDQHVQGALDRLAHSSVHLALIDLDDFKLVNDRLGHHVGDQLLVAVADRLTTVAGPADRIVRLGGDEFAMLLAPASAEQADDTVRRIAEALHRPMRAGGHDLLIQASIGLACGDGVPQPRELLRRADVAMYVAKASGKHRTARFESSMDDHAAEDARVGAHLRHALTAGDLRLVYQPIVELPTGAIVGAEALIRWHHPDLGTIPPSAFIPVAERNGLIVALGEWILREACAQAARWREIPAAQPIRTVSVNVSARQLRDPDFPTRVAEILLETGLDANRLTVEVTETAVFDGGTALDSVRALHDLGIHIALDDFGTGHSSLGLLRICPVDVLKVDKSFVDEISVDGDQAVIATALIHIADGMHLRAIAEGVETAAQAEKLSLIGYRYAQGYHFGRPMLANDLTATLQRAAAAPLPV
jgi:diguanylate cyclase (GGDEF)-like protein